MGCGHGNALFRSIENLPETSLGVIILGNKRTLKVMKYLHNGLPAVEFFNYFIVIDHFLNCNLKVKN